MSVVSSPAKATVGTDPNPLLIGHGLPPFSDIQPGDVVPGIEQLLETLGNELSAIEEQLKHKLDALPTTALTWSDLIEPLTALTERLSWSWGIIGHLMGVKNSPELRAAYESVQPALVEFSNRIGQSQVIYTALGKIKAGESWSDLEPAQKRIVEAALQDAELSGVGLSGPQKETFNDIQRQLADLSTQFSNHVLDATKAFSLTLTQPEEVAGLPPSLLSLAAQAARDAAEQAPEGADEVELGKKATAETGPWRITLDMPSYIPFLRHAQRRDLREQLYRAFITRASVGELDNAPLIEKILALRSQKAHLLGFENYAELSLAKKMAPSVSAVEKLMEELRSASYDAAHRELEEIKAFASQQTSTSTETDLAEAESIEIKQWDVPFWTERMREQQFDLSDEALRPYFPLPNVLEGLFGLAERLFGITIADAAQEAPVWHPDVRYFQVSDATTQDTIAHFYLDPYSRPAEKRGGAWMDECIVRAKVQSPENNSDQIRLPVAYLVCNQSPPIDGKPSLMTFREVETLFHEFGHGLQHMLTAVDYPGAAGINNVEWDAVELPSQFMENWCYDRDTLFGMAQHYETGEPLPEADYQKLLAARHFMTGNAILRQVNFGWTDMALHADYRPEGTETVWEVRDRIAQKATIMPPLPEDAFLCSFGHIFSGGYAAGYYSYFWAEVLSADAFSAFEEAGLEDKEQVSAIGRRFRDTVLALGGSHHPMEVFKAFRGREPSTQALLRHRGLAGNGASHTPNNRGKKAA